MENNVIVKLDNVTKKFGNTTVIKNFSLSIYEGEFITLLGASGCGKTTVLRIISGLEDVSSGEVYIMMLIQMAMLTTFVILFVQA